MKVTRSPGKRQCLCLSQRDSQKNRNKKWHRSHNTDGGLTQSLAVCHLLLSCAVKPHQECIPVLCAEFADRTQHQPSATVLLCFAECTLCKQLNFNHFLLNFFIIIPKFKRDFFLHYSCNLQVQFSHFLLWCLLHHVTILSNPE